MNCKNTKKKKKTNITSDLKNKYIIDDMFIG